MCVFNIRGPICINIDVTEENDTSNLKVYFNSNFQREKFTQHIVFIVFIYIYIYSNLQFVVYIADQNSDSTKIPFQE